MNRIVNKIKKHICSCTGGTAQSHLLHSWFRTSQCDFIKRSTDFLTKLAIRDNLERIKLNHIARTIWKLVLIINTVLKENPNLAIRTFGVSLGRVFTEVRRKYGVSININQMMNYHTSIYMLLLSVSEGAPTEILSFSIIISDTINSRSWLLGKML